MDPITLALLAAAAGGAAGFLGGHLFASTKYNKEIEQLKAQLIEVVEINKQREQEIKALRNKVQSLQAEVDLIKQSRGLVAKFLVWIKGEHPEVLEKFQKIIAKENSINGLQEHIDADCMSLDSKFGHLREKYPEEMMEFEEELHLPQEYNNQYVGYTYEKLCEKYILADSNEKWEIYNACKQNGWPNPY